MSAGSFLLGLIGLIVIVGLVGIAVYQARTGKSILGPMIPSGSGGKTPSWLRYLLMFVGLLVIISIWAPFADGFAAWFVDSDAGRAFGATYDSVRTWLWVPAALVVLTIIAMVKGPGWLANRMEAMIAILIMFGVVSIVYASIFEGLGKHRAGCGLNDAGTGLTNRIELTTFEVLTVGVCPGETALFITENGLPPEVRFSNLTPGELEAFADKSIDPYWFVEITSIGNHMYRVTGLENMFERTSRSHIELVFTQER